MIQQTAIGDEIDGWRAQVILTTDIEAIALRHKRVKSIPAY
jgi:hypothetical protein